MWHNEYIFKTDDDQLFAQYRETLAPIHNNLKKIENIDIDIKLTESKYHVPTLVIGLNSNRVGRDPQKLLQQLLDGEPRVFMTYDANEDCLSVNPINLQQGENLLLSERLAEVLT